jgi:hypothetical protein
MLDLYCGRGGWTKGFIAHGFQCDGYDINPKFKGVYPGTFFLRDIRDTVLEDFEERDYSVVCASPPCEEFSRHTMPWTRAKNPPEPVLALELARYPFQIADWIKAPLILENVATARRWLGPSVNHCGPFHLWGDGVPALIPYDVRRRVKESYGSKERDKRAEIPFDLADWLGRVWSAGTKE